MASLKASSVSQISNFSEHPLLFPNFAMIDDKFTKLEIMLIAIISQALRE